MFSFTCAILFIVTYRADLLYKNYLINFRLAQPVWPQHRDNRREPRDRIRGSQEVFGGRSSRHYR